MIEYLLPTNYFIKDLIISDAEKSFLTISDYKVPQLHGLLKIHKTNIPVQTVDLKLHDVY